MSISESYFEKLKCIFENAKVGIAICNAENNCLDMVNPAFAHIHGYEPDELIGLSPSDVFAPECILQLKAHENNSPFSAISDISFEATHIHKDGSSVPVDIHITVVKNEEGVVTHRISNILDISDKKREEEQLHLRDQQLIETKIRLSSLISTIPDLIWMKDPSGIYLFCNTAYEEFMDTKEEDIIGKTDYDFYTQEAAEFCKKSDLEAIDSEEVHISEEVLTYKKTNTIAVMEIRKAPIYHPDGKLMGVLGIARDITERKKVEKQIEFMAHHDALTGLPNRILAKDRTTQIIARAKRNSEQATLIFIDLDGFKVINDTMGHSSGDEILKNVASRLKEGIRASDTVSRQGGDEFVLILSDIRKREDVVTIVEKLLIEFEKPFYISDNSFSLSASIGVAMYPEHGESFEELMQNADTAMYKAKEAGKNGYFFYTQEMNKNILGQFKLQNDLKNGIKNNEFVLYYQPQIDIEKNYISGAEALIRWNHPEHGMIPPMSFIPIAESSGLIVQIGQWVIEEACRQAMLWYKKGIPLTVAINISAIQFKRGNLESIIKSALNETKLPPFLLELELTESVMMHNVESTLQTVQSLKALGVQLSIDDFGTGYSSLAYLKRFAVDKLKIDQSFIRDIIDDQEDAVIVQTIIQMARSLNLHTIAEGVENAHVLECIKSYGCDEVQGYHFAKPMKADDFELYYSNFNFTKEA